MSRPLTVEEVMKEKEDEYTHPFYGVTYDQIVKVHRKVKELESELRILFRQFESRQENK
jgi:hypothetical protein